jgi:hypothetical protein
VHSTALTGETKGNRQLGRSRHRWKDIKTDVTETRWRGMGGADWIHTPKDMGKQQPLVSTRAGLMGVSDGQLTGTPSCNGH